METCFKESSRDDMVLKGSKKTCSTFCKITWLLYLNVSSVCFLGVGGGGGRGSCIGMDPHICQGGIEPEEKRPTYLLCEASHD